MSSQSSQLTPRLLVVAAALFFSTGGAAVKATTLSGWQTAGFRSLVAGLALLAVLPEARRGWSRLILLPAAAYALTLVLFVHATKLTTAANAIYLQSTAPAYMLLLGPLVLHERLQRRDLLFAGILGVGMMLFFLGAEQPRATAPNPALGNLVAAGSGLAWAITLTALRWLASRQSDSGALATVVLGNLLAFAACAGMAFPVTWTLKDAAAIGYLGLFQIGLGYLCLTRGVRSVPAFEASVLLMIEPVMNPIWAWLAHGEQPGAWAMAGCVIILLATVGKVWMEKRLNPV